MQPVNLRKTHLRKSALSVVQFNIVGAGCLIELSQFNAQRLQLREVGILSKLGFAAAHGIDLLFNASSQLETKRFINSLQRPTK